MGLPWLVCSRQLPKLLLFNTFCIILSKEVIYKVRKHITWLVAVVLENSPERERHQKSRKTHGRIQFMLVYKMAKVSKLLMNKQTITKELHCKITTVQL